MKQRPLFIMLAGLFTLSSTWQLSFILGAVSWPLLLRAVRAQALSLKERDYIEAARALDLGTRHIIFRFVSNFRDWRQSYDQPLWNEWKPLLEPVLSAATAAYGYQRGGFPRVMLARMAPGGIIHPHRDENPAAKWPHKIHVPLQTNEDVTFFVDGVGYHLAEGEAVEVNNMGLHAVENRGSIDRIHLIFEYYDLDQAEPEWLAGLTAATARTA